MLIKVPENAIQPIGDGLHEAAMWIRSIIAGQGKYSHLQDATDELLNAAAREAYDDAVSRTGNPEVGERYCGLISVGNDLYWLGRPRHRGGHAVMVYGKKMIYQGRDNKTGMCTVDDGKW